MKNFVVFPLNWGKPEYTCETPAPGKNPFGREHGGFLKDPLDPIFRTFKVGNGPFGKVLILSGDLKRGEYNKYWEKIKTF